MKNVSILGSTGSIGRSTLSVVASMADAFQIGALAAGRDIDRLAEQVVRFGPQFVSVASRSDVPRLTEQLRGAELRKLPEIGWGELGLIQAACYDNIDIVVSGTVGAVGFVPTYKALALGRRVCLANKETLGMRGETTDEVKRLILTASGGPFRQATEEEMSTATVDRALAHPTWNMGSK